MTHMLTASQRISLETTERTASCFSLIGTTFIFVTFVYSPAFRRPINRLVFYASWGNTLCNIATLMSQSGIRAGKDSHLCQLQGFLIQLFLPADALWNLAMAINVYMTIFRNYNAEQLKRLEWRYHIMAYGLPFVVALTYLFVETSARGRIYGPASLWCWVDNDWAVLRVGLCYAPAWLCMIVAFSIYIAAGRAIFIKRRQLRAFSYAARPQIIAVENPFTSFKTTEITVTSELADIPHHDYSNIFDDADDKGKPTSRDPRLGQYTVTINSSPMSPTETRPTSSPRTPITPNSDNVLQLRLQQHKNRAAMEANTVAWGYTKCAILFFVSLLITWVPSSVNRVYSLAHPGLISIPFTYASAVVLPLMGFWNFVIYVTTSWAACKLLADSIFGGGMARAAAARRLSRSTAEPKQVNTGRKSRSESLSDSMGGLASP